MEMALYSRSLSKKVEKIIGISQNFLEILLSFVLEFSRVKIQGQAKKLS